MYKVGSVITFEGNRYLCTADSSKLEFSCSKCVAGRVNGGREEWQDRLCYNAFGCISRDFHLILLEDTV